MKKILFIDDDKDLVNGVKAFLESKGFKVETAHSKADGQKSLHAVNPDLILLDVQMETDHAGFELNREIRMDASLKHIPVIIFSGIDTIKLSEQIVDLYVSMSSLPEFDQSRVLQITNATGTVAVDYKTAGKPSYHLPLDSFVSKPVDFDLLLKEINKHIGA